MSAVGHGVVQLPHQLRGVPQLEPAAQLSPQEGLSMIMIPLAMGPPYSSMPSASMAFRMAWAASSRVPI